MSKTRILNVIFLIVGLISIYFIIKDYGMNQILIDFKTAKFSLLLLIATFIPTLSLYSFAWMLVTPGINNKISIKQFIFFLKMMTISISWNNLTPFLKMGGEPYKYFMLRKILPKQQALSSAFVYNIVHTYATLLAFLITAITVPMLFKVPETMHPVFFTFFILCLSILFFSKLLLRKILKYPKKSSRLRPLFLKTKWALRQSYLFYTKNRPQIIIATLLEIVARFIEGITFYYAFFLINFKINILSALFLEVGRTLVDTLFFFIPFQLGSREEGIRVFMESGLGITSSGFLSVALMYRFVEIAWIIIGILLWPSMLKQKEETTTT